MLALLAFLIGCGTAALDVDLPHRPSGEVCDPVDLPEPTCGPVDGVWTTCAQHADCGSDWCIEYPGGNCGCRDDHCDSDADCEGQQLCSCASSGLTPIDTCMSAECVVDSDCATGLCMPTRIACGSVDDADQLAWDRWVCATSLDTCRSDDVCTEPGEFCVYTENERFECSQSYGIPCD